MDGPPIAFGRSVSPALSNRSVEGYNGRVSRGGLCHESDGSQQGCGAFWPRRLDVQQGCPTGGPLTPAGVRASRPRCRVRVGRLLLVAVAVAGAVAAASWQPAARLSVGGQALGRVALGGGTRVVSATASWGSHHVALAVSPGGGLVPAGPLPAGKQVELAVTVAPPVWLSWWPGKSVVVSDTLVTPAAPRLRFHHEAVALGRPVVVSLTRAGQVRGLGGAPQSVGADRDAQGESAEAASGTVDVETRAASWEAWSAPRVLRWTGVPAGSAMLTLQRDLAELGYLPLQWQRLGPGTGRFSWRYPMPAALTSLWTAGTANVLTTGAVWQFERETGLPVETPTNQVFWADLRARVAAHDQNTEGYTYVEVSQGHPERLRLWFNGKLVIRSLANTAKPPGVTHVGTFPVFLRYRAQAMRGTDPGTGQPYYYPHVPWVNYFKGNDAVHGFPRSHYGFPQSAGCVELPIATAKKVYGYMHYGTLVTVLPVAQSAT